MVTVIHINGNSRDNSVHHEKVSIESEDEGFSEQNSLSHSLTIKGPTGSVRGYRHCVRQSITSYYNIITKQDAIKVRNYEKEEVNTCVLYTTSMGVIRATYENCRKLK
ncbi:hypothetical protein B4U79_06787 [Dinothrombium tinctorium]|uniref:Uncharacterized protein n=1 Tax=Dinothrombium tinctorium TaxID=1965070 RepID=A0A443RNX3_9ACAR|nr:hypothetical protein B4U79_06787 [Dinothrombium tinctorium]